jgi:hypothetical protein
LNKASAVPLALGTACVALLCLARLCRPDRVSHADLQRQLSQIHQDLFIQRRFSVRSRRVLNDAHRLIHGVTKALEKQPS